MKSAACLLRAFSLGLPLASLPLALHAQAPGRFTAYEHCRFNDDLALIESTPLAKGIEGRTVKTVMGNRNVPLAGGTRLMYAYPHTEAFANVKVEAVPADGYVQAKQDLVANFEQVLTADDSSTRNYTLKPRLNGLEVYGLDRNKLEGGVLGMYLFFVDRTHTATTIYFLNQDPAMRRFDSLEDYARLRDSFLQTYTGCAAGRVPPVSAAGTRRIAPNDAASAPGTPVPEAVLPDAPGPAGSTALPNAEPAATTGQQGTDPYVPPEAAPLVHPRSPSNRKGAKGTKAHTNTKQTDNEAKPGKPQ